MLGKNSGKTLLEFETKNVIVLDESIENALHVSVGAKGLFDVSPESVFGVEFDGFEVVDVSRVEKHVARYAVPLVHFDGVAR